MKRILFATLAFTLSILLLLSGCTSDQKVPQVGSSDVSSATQADTQQQGTESTSSKDVSSLSDSSVAGTQSQVRLPIKPSTSSQKPTSSTNTSSDGGTQSQGQVSINPSTPTSSQKPSGNSSTSSTAKPNSSVVSAPDVTPNVTAVQAKDYVLYNQLSAKQKKAYTAILDAATALDRSECFLVGEGITERDASIALNAVRGDYPQLFWLPNVYGILKSGNAVYLAFYDAAGGASGNPLYDYSVKDTAELVSMQKQINDKVKTIVNSVIKNGMSQYQMELALHDWLCANMVYDTTPTTAEHSWDVYGALVNGSGVCEAYTKAFQLLLYTVGINNRPVYGTSKGSAPEAHTWNLVKIDGAWYHTDVTWNDMQINKLKYIHYYFNQTQKEFEKTHILQAVLNDASDDAVAGGQFNFAYPDDTATTANYYRMSGTYVQNETDFKTTVLNAFQDVEEDTTIEFYYAPDEAFTDAELGVLMKQYTVVPALQKQNDLSRCLYGVMRNDDHSYPFFFIRLYN